MLVNATQEEELRVAIVDGQKLYDLDIEVPSREQRKANIYKGRITRIEPSLEAAFVDYGASRHGFLPLKEISSEYFVRQPEDGNRVQIKEVLKEGQEIVVQVEKEERGNKGAALTTFVSLAGRFLVLMPNNPRAGGVSRRITGEDRDIIRQSLDELDLPDGMGCIVRTAGVGRSIEELRWDTGYLLSIWEAIREAVISRPAPFLIYQEGNAIVRAVRDHFSNEIGEILVDGESVHKEAYEFIERVMPNNLRKLKRYEDAVPLFTRYQIESQIESAFAHSVTLPSGGSIVIDPTEALTAIDINSARATKGDDIEETALNTNLESADEIARQLRIRDLGGLIVIDFIDMGPNKNQRDVENRLRDAVRQDRARIQIGRISRFGLLEMSRQRLRPSLGEATQLVCPRCVGMGNIRGVESLALAILRLVGEEARKERTAKVVVQLPVDVSNYILNEKRDWAQSIQDESNVSVVLIGNRDLDTPNYMIKRVRDDELDLPENNVTSYKQIEPKTDVGETFQPERATATAELPAVASIIIPQAPAPQPAKKAAAQAKDSRSIWQRLFGWMSPTTGTVEPPPKPRSRSNRSKQGGRNSSRRSQSDRNQRDRGRDQGKGRGNTRDSGSGNSSQNRDKNADGESGGSSPRGRRPRRRRGSGSGNPQNQNQDQGQNQASAQGPAESQGQADSGKTSTGNRSGNKNSNRRGRRRKPTPKDSENTNETTTANASTDAVATGQPTPAETPAPSPGTQTPVAAAAVAQATEGQSEQQSVAPATERASETVPTAQNVSSTDQKGSPAKETRATESNSVNIEKSSAGGAPTVPTSGTTDPETRSGNGPSAKSSERPGTDNSTVSPSIVQTGTKPTAATRPTAAPAQPAPPAGKSTDAKQAASTVEKPPIERSDSVATARTAPATGASAGSAGAKPPEPKPVEVKPPEPKPVAVKPAEAKPPATEPSPPVAKTEERPQESSPTEQRSAPDRSD